MEWRRECKKRLQSVRLGGALSNAVSTEHLLHHPSKSSGTSTFHTDVSGKRMCFLGGAWRKTQGLSYPSGREVYLNVNGFMTQMSFRNLLLCLDIMTWRAFQVGSYKATHFL